MSAAPKRAEVDVSRIKDRFSDLFDTDVPTVGNENQQQAASPTPDPKPEVPIPSPLEAELQRERELRQMAEQKLAELEQERELWRTTNQKLKAVTKSFKETEDQLNVTQQKNQELEALVQELTEALAAAKEQAEQTAASGESATKPVEIEVDVEKFLAALKAQHATRSNGTSHYVAQEVDDWLEGVKSEFYIFGRKQGPNMAAWYWNMGVMLLMRGLSNVPDWQERIRALAYSPDLALAEVWRLALTGLAKQN